MNKSFCIVLVALAAAFGCMADPVTKTRLGSLNPREGLVVTDVDLSGVGGAGNYEVVSNKAMNAAPATKIELDCFVKDDGTIFHFVTNGVWSTVKKYGSGWDDSYLAGARIYMWYSYETGSTNWTWYLTGGSSSEYRTVQADADADILRFRYSAKQTNVFVRGRMLLYAGEVGDMISKRFDASTNYTDRVVGAFAKTGTVSRASTYGTPTRWTDATGCVWEAGEKYPSSITLAGVGEYQYIGSSGGVHQWGPDSVHNYISFEDDGDRWTYYNDQSGVWIASHAIVGGEQTVTLQSAFSGSEMQISYVSHVGETNLVGRVALTNDITEAIREQSLGGIWDKQLEVWWTPIMQNGALKYVATTNVDLTAEGNE